MSKRSPANPLPSRPCSGLKSTPFNSFQEIVDHYIQCIQPQDKCDLKYWKSLRDLRDVVQKAALSRSPGDKKQDHQRRLPNSALERAAEVLDGVDFAKCKNFEELHQIIEQLIKTPTIKWIGELAVYDIALRIGMYLDVRPEYIYLHRGTRRGANALGLVGDKLHKNQLPCAFQKLSPAQIENCLCIYKESIDSLKPSS